MMARSFAADVQVAEELANAGWNVFMHTSDSTLLATRAGYTIVAEVGPAGREVEELIAQFVTDDMDHDKVEKIAYACLQHGYTPDEIDEAIDLITTNE